MKTKFVFFRKALNDIMRNRFIYSVTIITIILSVLIVGAFGLFIVNAGDIMNSWKQGIRLMAYLEKELPDAKLIELKDKILKIDAIESLEFISKKKGIEILKQSMKRQSAIFENLKINPLPDSFEIKIKKSFQNYKKIEIVAKNLESFEEINDVEYGQKWLGRFTTVFNLFKYTGLLMSGFFLMVSLFIIANTIRLAQYSRREEVEIMRLVGATDYFIKAPFYIQGIIQGAIGGIIGIVLLLISFYFISSSIEKKFTLYLINIRFLSFELILGIILCSMFVGWLGCYLSLKQFLKI